jgi:competence protein ComEC
VTVVQGTDLRLVPTAVLTWLTCLLAVGLDVRGVVLLALVLAAAGVALAGATAGTPSRWATAPDSAAVTATLALAVAALVCGVTAVQTVVREAGPLAGLAGAEEQVAVVGLVEGDPVRAGGWGERYRVRLRVGEVSGGGTAGTARAVVLVTGGTEWGAVRHGSRIRAVGRLTRAAREEPFVALLRAARAPDVLRAPEGGALVVERLRSGLREVTADLAPDRRGLVAGAAVGATQDIPDDLRQAMRDAGLTHVTAVSGAHFAVVVGTVLALLGVLRAPPVARAVVLVLTAWGFVQLVHGGASVGRAAAASAVWALALVLRRPARAVPALAGGVTVLLLVDPWLSRSYGFTLSVAATAAIVLLAPALVARRPAVVPRPLATVVAVPLAAQLVCSPVLVLLDPVVTAYAVPANVLAAPALLPATLLGLVATVLSPVAPAVAELVAVAAGVPAAWVGTVAVTAAGLPGARLPWLSGPAGAAALAVLLSGGVLGVLRLRPRSEG